jgi:hypothetical protein
MLALLTLYRRAVSAAEGAPVSEKAMSHRIFGVTAKIDLMRAGADLTSQTMNDALQKMYFGWPDLPDHPRPPLVLEAMTRPIFWAEAAEAVALVEAGAEG